MATLEQKLMRIVEEDLQGEARLETLPGGHVSGDVVSPLFEGKDYRDRRLLIREAIRRHVELGDLTADEQHQVGTLLTYTPAEWNVVLTDSTD